VLVLEMFLVVSGTMPRILGAKTQIVFLSYLVQSRVLTYSIILHNSYNISDMMIGINIHHIGEISLLYIR
jgi:hypothetical protein